MNRGISHVPSPVVSVTTRDPFPPLAPAGHPRARPDFSVLRTLTVAFVLALAHLIALCPPAAAGLVIRLDPLALTLAPNRPHQTVAVIAENTGLSPLNLGGLDLCLELGGATPNRPALQGVDLITGTLFESFNPAQVADPGNDPHRQIWYLTLPGLGLYPELPAAPWVTLATLEIDTTGIVTGDFPLNLTGTGLGDTVAYDAFQQPWIDARLHNDVLHVDSNPPPPVRLPDAGASSLTLTFLGLVLARALFPFHRSPRQYPPQPGPRNFPPPSPPIFFSPSRRSCSSCPEPPLGNPVMHPR